MAGRLFDTYVAALQHDLVDLPEGTVRLGVVRRPTPWFSAAVDENCSALGPPDSLLAAVKQRHEALVADGVEDATAHNRALAALDYDDRYVHHLETDEAAREAVESVRDRLTAGTDVALVCYENTAEKRCHRTRLREWILDADER